MLAVLLACVAMGLRDCIATMLTVAETRGKATLAGALDAGSDLAGIATTVFGAGLVIQDGLTLHSLTVIASMLVVSFFGTRVWTTLAQRIGTNETADLANETADLETRVAVLEKRVSFKGKANL